MNYLFYHECVFNSETALHGDCAMQMYSCRILKNLVSNTCICAGFSKIRSEKHLFDAKFWKIRYRTCVFEAKIWKIWHKYRYYMPSL